MITNNGTITKVLLELTKEDLSTLIHAVDNGYYFSLELKDKAFKDSNNDMENYYLEECISFNKLLNELKQVEALQCKDK